MLPGPGTFPSRDGNPGRPLCHGLPHGQHEEPSRLQARRWHLYLCKNKHVIVIGGGDTELTASARPCATVAPPWSTSKSCPSLRRVVPMATLAEWPRIFRVDYGHEEAAKRFGDDPRVYAISGKRFIDNGNGHVSALETIEVQWVNGRPEEVPGRRKFGPRILFCCPWAFSGPRPRWERRCALGLTLAQTSPRNMPVPHGP